MNPLFETYRTHRRNFQLPAIQTLRLIRAHAQQTARLTRTGFTWQQDHRYNQYAEWSENGFDLRAEIVHEDDGWWDYGVECIGKFIAKWQPGAIRHHRNRSDRDCGWFLPANPDYAHDDYRRACAYGDTWWYVGVEVIASRAGTVLGKASLWGIEHEPGRSDDYLTETAFDLASEAIREANEQLRRLCGCH